MNEPLVPWLPRAAARGDGFAAGFRLGALAALAGAGSAALRRGSAGDALARLSVTAVSFMVAALVWGACAGLWLARAASARWSAAESLVRAIAPAATRWCPAVWREGAGLDGRWTHGALVLDARGEWALIAREGRSIALGREAPSLGERSRGWGAALLGAPSEPLRFAWGIVYVDRAGAASGGPA